MVRSVDPQFGPPLKIPRFTKDADKRQLGLQQLHRRRPVHCLHPPVVRLLACPELQLHGWQRSRV